MLSEISLPPLPCPAFTEALPPTPASGFPTLPMKNCFLLFLILAVSAGIGRAVPRPMIYRQDFNGTGTDTLPWGNDSTIPGWYAQINNRGTIGQYAGSDGATAGLGDVLNPGAPNNTGCALGSKATGSDKSQHFFTTR